MEKGVPRTSNGAPPPLQVYAVALYVEAERAAKELGVRKRGGFFDDNRCATCAARYCRQHWSLCRVPKP